MFAVVAAVFSGLPLSMLLAPFLIGVTLVLAYLVELVFVLPPDAWSALEETARFAPNLWSRVRGGDAELRWLTLAAVLVLPGSASMLLAWVWIRALFRRVGVGGVLYRLGAREPNRRRLEEAQLVNIVEELAIAGGVRPPRVLLIDSAAANAAAVGLTIDDAAIVVTTGLLGLGRDERQAILAHLIGSVANGDLEIAGTVLSVLQTWGLLALLLDTPFGPRSRTAVRRFLSMSARASRDPTRSAAAAHMLDRLMDGAALTFDDLIEHTDVAQTTRPLPLALLVDVPLYVTLGVAGIAAKAAISLFTLLVFGPWVALLWRARRRLADATAVQLTRHPDALAQAVREMGARNVAVEGGEAVSFLFPFWTRWSPEAPTRSDVMEYVVGTQLELDDRLRSLHRLGATGDAADAAAKSDASAADQTSWKDVLQFVGWGVVAALLVAACIAFTLLTTSLMIWALWTGLRAVLAT